MEKNPLCFEKPLLLLLRFIVVGIFCIIIVTYDHRSWSPQPSYGHTIFIIVVHRHTLSAQWEGFCAGQCAADFPNPRRTIGTHNIIVSHLSDKLSWPESPTASLLQPNAYYYYCYLCYCWYYYDTKCFIAAVPGVYIIYYIPADINILYIAITFYRESAKITHRKM